MGKGVCFKAFFHFKSFPLGRSWQQSWVLPLPGAAELQNGAQVNTCAPWGLMKGCMGTRVFTSNKVGFCFLEHLC